MSNPLPSSPTSEGREEALPRYAIGIREFHSALGVEHDYADLSIERHPEGDWVKFAEVRASLTEAQAEIERLRSEIDSAMKVLQPNMPESGLRDACCQVKQFALSAAGNCESLEAEIERLKAEKVCVWHVDDVGGDGVYETDCKHVFECMTDGLKENGFEFCIYCSGRIILPCSRTRGAETMTQESSRGYVEPKP